MELQQKNSENRPSTTSKYTKYCNSTKNWTPSVLNETTLLNSRKQSSRQSSAPYVVKMDTENEKPPTEVKEEEGDPNKYET